MFACYASHATKAAKSCQSGRERSLRSANMKNYELGPTYIGGGPENVGLQSTSVFWTGCATNNVAESAWSELP
jgi:hypothetical protein